MKNDKIHLVPQPVIDCAENMLKAQNKNTQDMYAIRLEAIRDYCDATLKKMPTKFMFEDLHQRKARTGK